jgi:carbon storage regulator CsrA
MLVLSRGRNDKVVFPTLGITVEILRVEGRNVRIGIDAPKEIRVLRKELLEEAGAAAANRGAQPATEGLTHAARNRLQKATLGLHVLQRMLDAGQIDDAEPTIFKIFNELKSLEEELVPTAGSSIVSAVNRNGHRALIVEDDVNECELLAGYLRLRGFEVTTALDGLQAMVFLSKHNRTDIVLLDMNMPRFDGSETVEAIRLNPDYHGLKIFAVTGADEDESPVGVGPRGVDRWFRKPIDPGLLVDAIHDELVTSALSTLGSAMAK